MNLYDDEGNAAELNFGKEFDMKDTMCVTNDELASILKKYGKESGKTGISE